ncbi:hypothetical protein A9G41_12990 [Gilliamella sp. Nev5-1]|uniref:Lar family restriction alleviation protein n=1 Tax=Gilliamella sp. Nev5-1 TaxID=3120251 RepID=UPI00082939A4|nr:Lar family restriction alleviation protein [Gilliamella apicola]OCG66303.1 hypothetical protein A9G41_12990 [Gilliamella apicola]
MTEQLKPCPFCGSEYLFIDEIDYRLNEDIPEHLRDAICFAVVCYDCNARGCEKDTENKAILAWNSRISKSQKHINEIKAQAIEEAVKKADNETYIGVVGSDFPPQKQYKAEILAFADSLRLKHE